MGVWSRLEGGKLKTKSNSEALEAFLVSADFQEPAVGQELC